MSFRVINVFIIFIDHMNVIFKSF